MHQLIDCLLDWLIDTLHFWQSNCSNECSLFIWSEFSGLHLCDMKTIRRKSTEWRFWLEYYSLLCAITSPCKCYLESLKRRLCCVMLVIRRLCMTWRTVNTRMLSIACQYMGVHMTNGTSWQSGRSSTMFTQTMFAGLYKCHAFCELHFCHSH